MSHNTYTLNNVGGNVLSYHGANLGIIYIGHGESASMPTTSPYFGDTGGVAWSWPAVPWYDSNPINTISGASFTQSNNWITEFHLPAGDYEMRASISMQISDGSAHLFFFMEEKIGAGAYAFNYDAMISNRSSTGLISKQRVEVFKFSKIMRWSSAVSIRFQGITENWSTSGGTTDPNNRLSETQYMYIRRLA
jgi:hypothetical protein